MSIIVEERPTCSAGSGEAATIEVFGLELNQFGFRKIARESRGAMQREGWDVEVSEQ